MTIPTEPIGSIPRPVALIDKIAKEGLDSPDLEPLFQEATRTAVRKD